MTHEKNCPGRDPVINDDSIVCRCEDAQQLRINFGLLTEEDLALVVGVIPETLEDWRGRGQGPDYVKLGRTVFYRVADVTAWVNQNIIALREPGTLSAALMDVSRLNPVSK